MFYSPTKHLSQALNPHTGTHPKPSSSEQHLSHLLTQVLLNNFCWAVWALIYSLLTPTLNQHLLQSYNTGTDPIQTGWSYHIIWPGICLSHRSRECDTKLTKSSTRPCPGSPFVHLSLPCCFCNSKWISDSLSLGLFKPNGLVRSQDSRCCSAQHLHLPIQIHLSLPTLEINQRDLSGCFKLWCLSGVCLSSSLFLGVCSWHLGVGGN